MRAAVLGVLLVAGCTDAESARIAAIEAEAQRAAEFATLLEAQPQASDSGGRALVFRLMFDAAVDLDLYVTDPQQETVYFANHRTDAGGRLIADARCESAPSTSGYRVEEIRFDAPFAGRYRVGVDLPERCDGAAGPAGYAVSVRGPGFQRDVSGVANLEQFEPVVLEFDLEGR